MTHKEFFDKIAEMKKEYNGLKEKAEKINQVMYYATELQGTLHDIDVDNKEIHKYFEYVAESKLSTKSVTNIIRLYKEEGVFACAEEIAAQHNLRYRL